MHFFKTFSPFHKIYFIFFLVVNLVVFFSPLATGGSIHNLISIDALVPLVSTIAGLFAAIYTARGQKWAYTWGFINVVAYIFVSLSRHLYGEVSLYLVYMLPMQVVGFYSWSKNSTGETVEAKTMKKKHWLIFLAFFIIFWSVYATYVNHLPDIFKSLFDMTIKHDKEFMIDSLTATLTVSAVVLATNRFVEQWYLWIVSDSIGIVLFIVSIIESGSITASAISGALMWIQFTSNAIYGYMCWRKIQANSATKANVK